MDEVVVVEYDPQWPRLFVEEAAVIRQAVGKALVAVEHVGSTSVPGLWAKPVLDILVCVTSLAAGEQRISALAALGYERRGENGIPGRLFFRKVSEQRGRTHHLHMVETGHEQWTTMLSFRDHLRADPEAARRYEALKRSLVAQFRENRRAYTDGKADFIQSALAKRTGR